MESLCCVFGFESGVLGKAIRSGIHISHVIRLRDFTIARGSKIESVIATTRNPVKQHVDKGSDLKRLGVQTYAHLEVIVSEHPI